MTDAAKVDQQAFYEDFWSRTEDQRIHGPVGRHTRRLIRRALEGLPFKSVLDVGCGEGTMISELFADRNDLRLVGTDISTAALAMAAIKNPHADFRFLDLRQGPFEEKFDLVISSEVIEHLEDDRGAVQAMAAMTGRYLLLTTLGGRMRSHEKDIGHQRNYDPEGLKAMVASMGLKPIRLIQWGWPFFSPLYRDFLNTMGDRTLHATTGQFGPGRKFLARFIYAVFCLNSHRRGDELVLVAERERPAPVLPPLPAEPVVSVVIPVRNEERYMPQCIASLRKIDYPADKLEIIFADGESTDRTVEIAHANRCRIVPNPGLNVASGRNEGFAAARGDIVVFSDADCLFDPLWVKHAIRHFRDPAVAGLGGPTRVPSDQNAFGRAVGAVFELAGLIGTTVHHARLGTVREAEDLPGCNAFYRREALRAIMPTNTVLSTNEDVEMNAQIRAEGYRLFLTPDVHVEHYKRPTPAGLWKQMRAFAAGRVRLARRDRGFLKAGHWLAGAGIPAAALVLLAGGLFFRVLWFLAGLGLAAGLLLCMLFVLFRHGPVVAVLTVPAVLVAVPGWICGFLGEWFRPTPPPKRGGVLPDEEDKP